MSTATRREKLTDEQFTALEKRVRELQRRIEERTLPYNYAMNVIQQITEGWLQGPPVTTFNWQTSPREQMELAKRLNQEREWGFLAGDFGQLARTVPTHFGGHLTAVVLEMVPRLTLTECVAELAACLSQGGLKTELSYVFGPTDYSIVDGRNLLTVKQGMRWRVVELAHVDNIERGAGFHEQTGKEFDSGLAVLSAAVHFPSWVAHMDGRRVPFAYLPGIYKVTKRHYDWSPLYLHWGHQKSPEGVVELGCQQSDSDLKVRINWDTPGAKGYVATPRFVEPLSQPV